MAKNEIRYDVKVDSSDAQRGLRDFSRAAQDAGKDAARSLEDTATAGDKAREAIKTMAQAFDTELRDAASAADALKASLGESADQFDTTQIVADLNRMGVSFDEIRGDADKFAATLREVDGIRVQQINDGLEGTRDRLRETDESAQSSRNALANMFGNSAQDISGLNSSLGVAIGQLAEFSADAALSGDSLKNIGKNMGIAFGAIGGIAAASTVLSKVTGSFEALRASQETVTKETEQFTEAVRQAGSVTEALNTAISEGTEFTGQELSKPWQELMKVLPFVSDGVGDVARQQDTLIGAMADAGVTADEWTRAAEGAGHAQGDLSAKLRDAQIAGRITDDQFDLLVEQMDLYRLRTIDATAAEEDRQQVFDEGVRTQGELTDGLTATRVALGATETLWGRVIRDAKDGAITTEAGADAYNRLQAELGKTNVEMDEMVAQKVNEQLEADAEAGADAADRFAELADTMRQAQEAAADYNRVVSSKDFGATTFEAAQTAIGGYFDTFFAAGDEAADQAEAYDNLGEALQAASDAGLSWFDTLFSVDSAEGRNARKALRELGTTLIPDITDAFQASGGDIETFRKKMAELGERTLQRLQDELGISRDQANALAQQLGLVPENVETMYKLIGDEDAKLKLGLLQSAIDALPENVNTQVTQKILLGDYQGALAIVQNYYNRVGATVPVDADMTQAYQALRDFAAAVRGARIVAGVAAQFRTTGTATTASAGAATLTATQTVAAPAVTVTTMPSVTIHTAVIGSRYSVQRAVAQALRGYTRINGTRTVAA